MKNEEKRKKKMVYSQNTDNANDKENAGKKETGRKIKIGHMQDVSLTNYQS